MRNPKSVYYAKAKDGSLRRLRLLRLGMEQCASNVPNATAKGTRFEKRIGKYCGIVGDDSLRK